MNERIIDWMNESVNQSIDRSINKNNQIINNKTYLWETQVDGDCFWYVQKSPIVAQNKCEAV
jgi:hypothetical protein